jgi:filamentous hemagglutinin
MMLPGAEALIVEREKITDYLLNPAHRYGESKARFFAAFGFRIEEWETLAHALREHGRSHEVTNVKETGFGPRYEVEGELIVPDGRRPRVRTVWQLDGGEVAPRLITTYPVGGKP